MEHSLQAYLERRTTEELDDILNSQLEQELTELNASIIYMVLNILWDREKDLPRVYPPELITYWERFMDHL